MSVEIKVPILTIDHGLLNIDLVSTENPARNSVILKSLIDDRLDILSPQQTFFFNGKLVHTFNFSEYSTDKPLHLITDLRKPATRFWLNSPEGRVKVSLSEDKYIRPISLITQFILDLDESMGLKYRKASKKLFVNGQELSDRDYVSDYPKDTEFTLEITEGILKWKRIWS